MEDRWGSGQRSHGEVLNFHDYRSTSVLLIFAEVIGVGGGVDL